MKYTEMNIQKDILKSILEIGWEEPTEIQEKAIPHVKLGKDIIAQSETGSGKTGAFGIPSAEKTIRDKGLQVLIISPTRELVEQITHVMRSITKAKKLRCVAIYGGVSINPQIERLQKSEIVIATPGRLLDHLERGTINFSNVHTVILDEADKMFEMGFIEDVEKILSVQPKGHQMLMFSATIRSDVRSFMESHLKDPVKIETKPFVDPSKLRQEFYPVPFNKKLSLLVHLIKKEAPSLAMVFCATRRETDIVERTLKLNGINASALHGGLSQSKRNYVMEGFRKESVRVLVATDVAARGLDIRNVSHVINYAIPPSPKEYVHRIGRTARMGDKGKAISLLDDNDHDNFRSVQSDHSLNIIQMSLPELERIKIAPKSDSWRGRQNPVQRNGTRQHAGHYAPDHSRNRGNNSSRRDNKGGKRYESNFGIGGWI